MRCLAVPFSEAEQGLYLRVHNEAKAEFHRYVSRGAHYVAKHLLSIMSLLSPLRAICSGGVLCDKASPFAPMADSLVRCLTWAMFR